jgi:ATP-binding cassette subfamily B multidrug efflux pump
MRPALLMLVLAVVAFIVRVASRIFCFNAGRDIEYDLRAKLLERLHRLGFSFYRRLSAGEIMSRATSDLGQIRLLTGFG